MMNNIRNESNKKRIKFSAGEADCVENERSIGTILCKYFFLPIDMNEKKREKNSFCSPPHDCQQLYSLMSE